MLERNPKEPPNLPKGERRFFKGNSKEPPRLPEGKRRSCLENIRRKLLDYPKVEESLFKENLKEKPIEES